MNSILFKHQQLPLALKTIGIARQRTVGTDDTMTRNDNGNGVPPHSTSHRLRRPAVDTTCDIAIRHSFPIRNGHKFCPNTLLKGST